MLQLYFLLSYFVYCCFEVVALVRSGQSFTMWQVKLLDFIVCMSAHSEVSVCKFGPKSIVLTSCLCWGIMVSRFSKSCSEPTSESILMLSGSKDLRSLSSSVSIGSDSCDYCQFQLGLPWNYYGL